MSDWMEAVVLGLSTVFVGLICLVLLTLLMSAAVRAFEKKRQSGAAVAAAAEETPAQSVSKTGIENRGAFIAAVSAAIATVMGADVQGLRIVSVKKVD